jgi:hypothetical protein
VTKDRPTCGDEQPDESLLVKGGRVANALVYVRAVPGVRLEPREVLLDQRRCRFVPRVLTAPAGSTLVVANGDPILHSAHGWMGRASVFNVPTPEQGERVSKALARPGLVRVGCDVHSWMSAYVWVADGPAAVTGADGVYALAGLPPGTWTVTVWHERLGERTAEVRVPASGDATHDFTFE